MTDELGWVMVWNSGPDAHDIESILIQIGNILKGITGGCTKFQKT
jgi:hypothetical protein